MDGDQRAWCRRVELSTDEINRLTPEDYEELMLAIDLSLGRPPSFYVEAILEHGHDPTGRTMYHVLWTHGVQSWEPEEHFMDDDGAVTEAFLEYLENITEDYHGSEANPIDQWQLFFDATVAGRPLHPTNDARTLSYVAFVTRTLQVQCNEAPDETPFSEDTVLYAPALPSFESTLSEEDSESLLSCLGAQSRSYNVTKLRSCKRCAS